jgi:hypothetical protein
MGWRTGQFNLIHNPVHDVAPKYEKPTPHKVVHGVGLDYGHTQHLGYSVYIIHLGYSSKRKMGHNTILSLLRAKMDGLLHMLIHRDPTINNTDQKYAVGACTQNPSSFRQRAGAC